MQRSYGISVKVVETKIIWIELSADSLDVARSRMAREIAASKGEIWDEILERASQEKACEIFEIKFA